VFLYLQKSATAAEGGFVDIYGLLKRFLPAFPPKPNGTELTDNLGLAWYCGLLVQPLGFGTFKHGCSLLLPFIAAGKVVLVSNMKVTLRKSIQTTVNAMQMSWQKNGNTHTRTCYESWSTLSATILDQYLFADKSLSQ
jgi:hypothetical protein